MRNHYFLKPKMQRQKTLRFKFFIFFVLNLFVCVALPQGYSRDISLNFFLVKGPKKILNFIYIGINPPPLQNVNFFEMFI